MSPWSATHSVPNTLNEAANRLSEFYKGEPSNLKGLQFLCIEQLLSAMGQLGMTADPGEPIFSDPQGKLVPVRVSAAGGAFKVLVEEETRSGNIPLAVIVRAWRE